MDDLKAIGVVGAISLFVLVAGFALALLDVSAKFFLSNALTLYIFTENIFYGWNFFIYIGFFAGLILLPTMIKDWRSGITKISFVGALILTAIADYRFMQTHGGYHTINMMGEFLAIMSFGILPIVSIAGIIYSGGLLVKYLIRVMLLLVNALLSFIESCFDNISNSIDWCIDVIEWIADAIKWVSRFKEPQNRQREKQSYSRKSQSKNEKRQQSNRTNPNDDFDASRFGGSAHYGAEKHHPDDSSLWNVVNDPNAPENEQMNALRAIKKREARRNGGIGRAATA